MPRLWTINHADEFYVAGGEVAPPKPQELVGPGEDLRVVWLDYGTTYLGVDLSLIEALEEEVE